MKKNVKSYTFTLTQVLINKIREKKKTRKKFYITKLFALKIEETGKFNKEYF